MTATCYLLLALDRDTGRMLSVDMFSERHPTVSSKICHVEVTRLSAHDYDEAHRLMVLLLRDAANAFGDWIDPFVGELRERGRLDDPLEVFASLECGETSFSGEGVCLLPLGHGGSHDWTYD